MTEFGQLKFNFLASTCNGHSFTLWKRLSTKKPCFESAYSGGFCNHYNFCHYRFLKMVFLWQCCKCHNAPLIKPRLSTFQKYMIWYGLDNFEKKFMCHFIRIAHILICHRRHSALAEASCNHHLFFKKIASDSWYLVAHFLASQWWHQRYRTHVGYSIQKF